MKYDDTFPTDVKKGITQSVVHLWKAKFSSFMTSGPSDSGRGGGMKR